MPKIGAHVSAAVSLDRSISKALEIGAECTQFFISPPQQWVQSEHDEKEIAQYRKRVEESGIGPNFIHGTYLVNLGTPNPEHLNKSIDWLIYALNMADKLGVRGVIFHTGSHKGEGMDSILGQVVETIRVILANTKRPGSLVDSGGASLPRMTQEKPYLILETAASSRSIGYQFSDLGKILKGVNDPRLKVCLDIQHSFAGGYDPKSPLTLKDVLEEFEEEIGLANLVAIHANDSKVEHRSNRDRHENIGEGFIGKEGFINLINHPRLKDVPFILEVPGFAGNGPDKENVDTLKSLVNK